MLKQWFAVWAIIATLLIGNVSIGQEYEFQGSGVVSQFSDLGIQGESVSVSFNYSIDDFPGTSGGNPDISVWNAAVDIPIEGIGTLSGSFDLSPVVDVGVFLAAQDTQVWFTFRSGNGIVVLQAVATTRAFVNETSFESPMPETFKEAHAILLEEFKAGKIWQEIFDSDILGASDETIILSLDDFEWTIVPVSDVLIGDVNLDGVVDLLDVNPFVEVLTTFGFQEEADINQDGVVNLLDVEPFVELLMGG